MNDFEKAQSCMVQVTQQEPYLTGENVIIAVLDSGIDYFLPEFRDADGQTRILAIWDQTGMPDEEQGRLPPPGYREGVLYTREMINEALALGRESGQKLVPVLICQGMARQWRAWRPEQGLVWRQRRICWLSGLEARSGTLFRERLS